MQSYLSSLISKTVAVEFVASAGKHAADYFNRCGDDCFRRGQLGDAAECFKKALILDQGHWVARHSLACLLLAEKRNEEAIVELERALRLNPGQPTVWCDLATALFLRDPEQGILEYREILKIYPTSAKVLRKLGASMAHMGNFQEAIQSCQGVLALNPNDADAHLQLAFVYLLLGDFSRGWPEYEWRRTRNLPQPLWRGETLDGAPILIHAEQGLGDILQFVRYVPMVAARGGRVVLEVPSTLRRLVSSVQGVEQLITQGEECPPVAWQCPLLSLPLAFGTDLAAIPSNVPYLSLEAGAVSALQEAKELCRKGLKVGLVWAGDPRHPNDSNRSITLDTLAPLSRVQDVSFYSLQKGPATQLLKDSLAAMNVRDLGSETVDFSDTAAAITALDLVITVDTSTAHLAGALGKPVWILLPACAEWRWLLNRTDSPWYPTARLFRQHAHGQWGPVVDEVKKELQRLAANRVGP